MREKLRCWLGEECEKLDTLCTPEYMERGTKGITSPVKVIAISRLCACVRPVGESIYANVCLIIFSGEREKGKKVKR